MRVADHLPSRAVVDGLPNAGYTVDRAVNKDRWIGAAIRGSVGKVINIADGVAAIGDIAPSGAAVDRSVEKVGGVRSRRI